MPLLRECFQHLEQIERKRIEMPTNIRMRLNRGERPEPLPPALRDVIMAPLPNTIQEYPSYQAFYKQLADHIEFPIYKICVGAGIEDFIRTLTFLCCDPGQSMAVTYPTCAMYDIYAKAFSVALEPVWTYPGMVADVDSIIRRLEQINNLRLFFLPNPGQPVDLYFHPHQLREIAKWCYHRDIVFAIDEACGDFAATSALTFLQFYPWFKNVVVLRTFSKFFYGAWLRVGYAVGQEGLIRSLHAVRPSGEIAGPSLVMASRLLRYEALIRELAIDTTFAMQQLVYNLGKLPDIKAYGEWGFSVLIEFPDQLTAQRMGTKLAQRGILVKVGFGTMMEDCMLVSCGSPTLMRQFFDEFAEEWELTRKFFDEVEALENI